MTYTKTIQFMLDKVKLTMLANGYIPGSTYTMLLPEGTPGDDPVKSWRPSVQSVPSQENRLQAYDAIQI